MFMPRAYPTRQPFPSQGGPIKPAGLLAPAPSIQPVQQPMTMTGGPMAPPQAGYAPPQQQAPSGGGFIGMLRNAYSRLPHQTAQMPAQSQPQMPDNRARVMQAMMAQGGGRY